MELKKALRHWKVKGLIQAALSTIPGGSRVNDSLQTALGGLRNFDGNIAGKVGDWAGLMSYLDLAHHRSVEGWTILELGTGWYPTLPFCFALAGAQRIYTVDLTPHLSAPLTLRMFRTLEPYLDEIARRASRPRAAVHDMFGRLLRAKDPASLLEMAGIMYRAPQDGAELHWLVSDSLDMAYSNSVLEHVLPEVISPLMRESWRVLKPDGLMVHAVACNDHYAHFDSGISFVNYLQYSERQWRIWNNHLNYQNRLRAPDFVRFAQNCGFRILHEARAIRPGTREALSRMQIATQFHEYAPDDLVATSVDFVAAKTARKT